MSWEGEPALTGWAEQRITPLPAGMANEVRIWFTVMREGSSTPPRRRPRSETTIRLHLCWALPALIRWAADGKTSLREISPADVRAVLAPSGLARTQMGQGLRSLFRVLQARRLVFTDPACQVKTAFPDLTIPMPLPVDHIRDALRSTDPTRALLCALLAFHGLSAHQVRHLTLTDLTSDGNGLTVEGLSPAAESRWIPLALSETLAAVTQTARRRPRVSTPIWRLRPAIFLPASMPCPAVGTLAEVLTLWASSTHALGSASRPTASRTSRRSRPLSWSNTPSFCQAAKYP